MSHLEFSNRLASTEIRNRSQDGENGEQIAANPNGYARVKVTKASLGRGITARLGHFRVQINVLNLSRNHHPTLNSGNGVIDKVIKSLS